MMTSEEGADWRRIFFDNVYRHHRTLYGREAPKEPNQDQLQEFCEGVRTLAKQYVDDPDLHDPAMTHFLLLDVLQSQQQILLWTAQWGVHYKVSFRRSLPSPYRYFVSPLLGVVIYVASIGLLWWLDTRDHSVLAIILTVWMCYWYLIQRPNTWWQRSRARKHFSRLAQLLAVPIYEIRSKTYDPDTIRRRLEACDQHDLYIASIAFALLKVLPTSFAVRT